MEGGGAGGTGRGWRYREGLEGKGRGWRVEGWKVEGLEVQGGAGGWREGLEGGVLTL